jgi:hypothetical protein
LNGVNLKKCIAITDPATGAVVVRETVRQMRSSITIFTPALTDDVPTSHQAGWQARGPGEDVSDAS